VVDLLGFSIGSFVAQEIALTRPSVVNRVVLASSAPKGAPDMHGWATHGFLFQHHSEFAADVNQFLEA
jgi:pimeloyl-ACP methyl ester carboxylesterase